MRPTLQQARAVHPGFIWTVKVEGDRAVEWRRYLRARARSNRNRSQPVRHGRPRGRA